MEQGLVRGDEHLGHGTGFDQRQPLRHVHGHAVVDAREFGIGAATDDAHDPVADGEALHLRAQRHHRARDLQAHGLGVAELGAAVGALAVRDVGPVDPDRGVAHQKIMGPDLRPRDLAGHEHLGPAEVVERYGLHGLACHGVAAYGRKKPRKRSDFSL